ncbi:MAG: translation initiation factor IF-3 [Fusobacteriota bacterium]
MIISKKDEHRINDKIRAKKVRLIVGGDQEGIVTLQEALDIATKKELDLVEVAPNSKPPVCKVMDYGKYKYEKEKQRQKAKKKQNVMKLKEMKFKPRIEKHDFDVKCRKVEEFLEDKNKAKLTLMIYGREKMHMERGLQVLEDAAKRFEDKAKVDRHFGPDESQKYILLTPILDK